MYTPPFKIPQGQEADRAYTDEDTKWQTKITTAWLSRNVVLFLITTKAI